MLRPTHGVVDFVDPIFEGRYQATMKMMGPNEVGACQSGWPGCQVSSVVHQPTGAVSEYVQDTTEGEQAIFFDGIFDDQNVINQSDRVGIRDVIGKDVGIKLTSYEKFVGVIGDAVCAFTIVSIIAGFDWC